MALFNGLNESQIMAKLLDLEESDGFSAEESKAYMDHKCSNDGDSVIVVGYLEYDYNYRTGEYDEKIMRYWLVLDKNNIVISTHVRYRAAKLSIGIRPKPKQYVEQHIDKEALALCRKVKSDELYKADRDNCAPGAIAIASGIPYEVVRKEAMNFGFKPEGGGMMGFQIGRLMKALGIKYETCTKELREEVKTTKAFTKKAIKGRYVISINGHALACVNGTVCDYSWNENRRIHTVRKIIS